jgi:molybdate transport system ATP-binding protein
MGESPPVYARLRDASLRIDGRLFLRGLDLELRAGEQWAVLGPNGAGKTVLAELIAGRRGTAGGERWLDPRIEHIGWLSFETQRELCEADARHDISEYLASAVDEGTTLRSMLADGGVGERGAVQPVIEALDIAPLLDRGLRFLSSGEMRRVLLARLLLACPRLAILDAPLEGIDAASRARIAAQIDRLLAGPSHVLLLTRRATEIPPGITHVLVLERGRCIAALRAAEAGSGPALPSLPGPLAPPVPVAGPLLQLKDVHARFGDHLVFEGLDLRLDAGEHLCIAGPNGCGKSTLLALICGDNPRAYGQQVRVCGRLRGDGESIGELKHRFGLVSNALHLGYPARSRVLDVVASGWKDTIGLYTECGPAELAVAHAWLAALEIADQAAARFDALSFGLQRLVLIARAMLKWPPLLILDEPCSGLDAPNRTRVLELVDRIAETGHTHLLYVSHEQDEMPKCITRRMEFRRAADGGGYRLV